jgi:hypothetical protein
MALVSGMSGTAVARLVGERDTRLWHVVQHYVEIMSSAAVLWRKAEMKSTDRQP